MTAETERTGPAKTPRGRPANSGRGRISWGRTLLRILIMTVAFLALAAFAAVLAELTLTPSPASVDVAGSNLRVGHSLRQYAEDYTFLAACKQVGGNLLMGAPFGVILPLLLPRRLRMLRVVLLTALVMMLVEMAQGAVVEGRAFDIDDVILNTGGALIAYLLVGRRLSHRFHMLAVPRETPETPAVPAQEANGRGSEPEPAGPAVADRPAGKAGGKAGKAAGRAGGARGSGALLPKSLTGAGAGAGAAADAGTGKTAPARTESWSQRMARLGRGRDR
ncbi:VanZ family protein [Streptomyces sp. NPDC012623]|uniref:VanZ family protein n=1 Tax=unclassified Streptomyces TaxID=2593676 RepID=UPI003677FE33